ncbi:MAG TPA: glycosyltransferase family 2 protein [Bacteroidetes bacterium]|nr:glycosyltransferase family 2 protein [Bacteroidota bacterium]
MNHISVVIITFNEERNIKRCLDSIVDVADEIVVIDSFSTDNTQEICNKYSVKFIESEWKGYSESKNFGIEQTSHSYILSIDADEELSEKLKKSILKEKSKGLSGAYSFNRLSNYCGKWIRHGDWYPDRKMRLWNKADGIWVGEIHEKTALNKEVKIKHIKGDLHHYSYYNISEHIQQVDKYSSLSAQTLFDKNKKAGFIKLVFSPLIQFNSGYFLRLGFLDGFSGLTIAVITAFGTFLKYAKLKELYQEF